MWSSSLKRKYHYSQWQDKYGAFSFDAKRLPNYIAYAERQKHPQRPKSDSSDAAP